MTKSILTIVIMLLVVSVACADATKPGDYYVTSDSVDVRLKPSDSGKVTNTLYKRQKVEVFEINNGWARVSRFYDGGVEGVSGTVARWVLAEHLSSIRPPDEKLVNVNSPIAKAIKSSDDFSKYQEVFIAASEELINSGRCTLGDFQEMGGWWRSSIHKPKAIYFTYCGGMRSANRIYVDAATGLTFK